MASLSLRETTTLKSARSSSSTRTVTDDTKEQVKNGSTHHKSSAINNSGQKATLSIIFVALIIDLLAFTLILPLLPSIMEYYQKYDQDTMYSGLARTVHKFQSLIGAPQTDHWNAVLFGGFIGSLFSILQFLACPVIGMASDVYGRKPVFLFSMFGVALSYLIWSFSKSFSLFILARILGGVSKGNVSLSTAVVTDVSSAEKRGREMALIGIAFSLGFIFGPLIGAAFSKMADKEQNFFVFPALFAFGLSLFNIIFVGLCLKESLPPNKRAKSLSNSWDHVSYLINPVSLFKFSAVKTLKTNEIHSMRTIGFVYFWYLFLFSGLEFTLTFLMHSRFGYTSMQQGKMFFFIGSFMALVQGCCTRRIPFGKEKYVATIGIAIFIPAFSIIAFASSTWIMYFALMLFSFGAATVVPCLTTLISRNGKPHQKGVIVGIFRSLGALARALGPIILCTLYWLGGPQLCYLTGAICLSLPMIVLQRLGSC